jgi:hypothetical protein
MALFRLLSPRVGAARGLPGPPDGRVHRHRTNLAVQKVIIIAGAHVADSVLVDALAAVVLIVVAVR